MKLAERGGMSLFVKHGKVPGAAMDDSKCMQLRKLPAATVPADVKWYAVRHGLACLNDVVNLDLTRAAY